MQRLRIGFVSSQNYLDRTAWSGTLYSMHQALLSTDLQVINYGSPRQPSRWQHLLSRAWSLLIRLWRKEASPKVGSPSHVAECKKFASLVQKQLRKTPCDVIFAPVIDSELNLVETNIPIVKLTDATFPLIQETYQINADQEEIEWICKHEALALSKASKIVYSSDWAAQSAIREYQVDPAKIRVIPFGPNFDKIPLGSEVVLSKATSRCILLFVGKGWQRKGGDIAFHTFISLREMGVDAELVVVGSVPPHGIKHDKLTVIPFLNNNFPQQRQQLYELFLKSNFLIFPTRADCSPLVISEASAFGLPVITSEVGGIPTLIRNGKNGYMLPLSASGKDYANLIVKNFSDSTCYEKLVRSTREEYDKRLNWNKWAEDMQDLIMSVFSEQSTAAGSAINKPNEVVN